MPAPDNGPHQPVSGGLDHLTPEEQAVVRRLLRRERPRKAERLSSPRRRRAALRLRRELMDRLGKRDLRRLAQIVLELGL